MSETMRGQVAVAGLADTVPYGLMSPAQMFAMKVVRFMHEPKTRYLQRKKNQTCNPARE